MDTRLLKGALAALVALLLLSAVQAWLPDWTLRSAFGLFAPLDFIATFIAMAVGGALAAQPRFRLVALGIQLLVVAASWIAYSVGPFAAQFAVGRDPTTLLRLNALPLAVGLFAAWSGAWVGERLARRRAPVAAPTP